MNKLDDHQVILYIRTTNYEFFTNIQITNKFILPENWRIKVIKWPYLWTQIGLSLELLFHPVDVLFVPAHTVPLVHPKNTVVTIHGLEYEFCPKAYSFWERIYMLFSIKNSCKWAKKIIAVSENTKKDLLRLYKVPEDKISVVYEGASDNFQFSIFNFQSNLNDKKNTKYKIPDTKYLLFVGRLEERKNVCGIIDAYKILKEKYDIPHSLVLAGEPGFNYGIVKLKIENLLKIENCKLKIIELGFVSEEEKYELLKNADVFLFPSFYEGFGLPILEAQSVGTPVVTSDISSIPEIAGAQLLELKELSSCSAILVNPYNSEEIAEATWKLISDENLKNDMIEKGLKNVKRFSWEKCGEEIGKLLIR
jgi:glycosyltransferase involved in cell wall biosynthesis